MPRPSRPPSFSYLAYTNLHPASDEWWMRPASWAPRDVVEIPSRDRLQQIVFFNEELDRYRATMHTETVSENTVMPDTTDPRYYFREYAANCACWQCKDAAKRAENFIKEQEKEDQMVESKKWHESLSATSKVLLEFFTTKTFKPELFEDAASLSDNLQSLYATKLNGPDALLYKDPDVRLKNFISDNVLNLSWYVNSKENSVKRCWIKLAMPELAPDNSGDILLFRKLSDFDRGIKVRVKPGRLYRAIAPTLNAKEVDSLVLSHKEQFIEEEYDVVVGFDRASFKEGYSTSHVKATNFESNKMRKSLDMSCMRGTNFSSYAVHPAEAYASGEFGIVYLLSKKTKLLGARCVFHEPTKSYGPIYTNSNHAYTLVKNWLSENGYEKTSRGGTWHGAQLLKIPVKKNSGYIYMPYVDFYHDADYDLKINYDPDCYDIDDCYEGEPMVCLHQTGGKTEYSVPTFVTCAYSGVKMDINCTVEIDNQYYDQSLGGTVFVCCYYSNEYVLVENAVKIKHKTTSATKVSYVWVKKSKLDECLNRGTVKEWGGELWTYGSFSSLREEIDRTIHSSEVVSEKYVLSHLVPDRVYPIEECVYVLDPWGVKFYMPEVEFLKYGVKNRYTLIKEAA